MLAAAIAALATTPGAFAKTYDIVIAGGRVMDPASGRDEIANIGIDGRRIAIISTEKLDGRRVLDARGMVVAPGFVDLHAHGQDPKGQYFQVLDGVTTAIDAEGGAMPIAPFVAALSGKALINFGATASHQCARMEVIAAAPCRGHAAINGETVADRKAYTAPATPEQQRAIVAALDREVAAGALGYGLGIEYTPGAGRSEIYDIFKAAAVTRAPVFVHVRSRPLDPAPGVPIAVVQEVLADAAVTGAPLQIVHLHSTGLGDTPTLIDIVKRARARGLDVTSEAYPYTAGSTLIGSEFFRDGWRERSGIDYGDLQWPATGERLTAESFARYRREQPNAAVVVHMIPEKVVDMIIAEPEISIASDGMPWRTSGEHPRGAGSFARVLGRYVREKQTLDLMTALKKMTIMPAERLAAVSPQMARKGRISVDADADITIFDPRTVIDAATFETPMQPSRGIRHVLVNGKPVVRDGKLVAGAFPGEAILGTTSAR
ncbi:D-glutamate deacylase [Sphingomonas cavernae]|uniref:D-glutamate deacylase n=2 Tax=Sphingomonas cavernae TaxID=2320861 RepID=A0A418WSI8_9SPHN|nr:D-glutamate deacylase [Sphingomonas cavernae]